MHPTWTIFKRELGADGEHVQGVFVSVDPERDTPQILKAYMASFDPGFVALRGTLEQTQAAAREFKVFFAKVPEGKTAKNRVHLDVNVGKDAMRERSQHLVSLGAELVGEYDEPGGQWITLRDPEGNEFCLQ